MIYDRQARVDLESGVAPRTLIRSGEMWVAALHFDLEFLFFSFRLEAGVV
jgi:hypothetical protein